MASFTPVAIVLILAFYRLGNAADDLGQDKLCPEEGSVDLSNATRTASGFLDETGRFFPADVARFSDGVWRGCICDLEPCLSLCAAAGNATGNIPEVYDAAEEVDPAKRFHIFVWEPCPAKSAYYLDPGIFPDDEFRLLGNGSLFLPRLNMTEHRLLDFKRFCFNLRANDTFYTPRVCSVEVEKDPFARVKYIGALVGVPFLIATFVVYSVLPELRNIHGTTLRCYLCCLVITYVALAIDRIPAPDYSAGPACLFLGFTIYFSFLASFFWLNVMCFDMWWRFGGFGSLRSSGAQSDGKKFIGYSMYAWGSAVILTVICIGVEFSPDIPKSSMFHPGFRLKACWFGTNTATVLYFIGPAGLTIASNICFFILTSLKILQHKTSMERQLNSGDSRRHDQNKQWFVLYAKLFVVMGISWSTEIISWAWDGPKYLWLATDMVNALQGLLIFIIFVCKKKICKSMRKRCHRSRIARAIFGSPSSESPATTASMDDSSTRCKVSVFVLEKLKTIDTGSSSAAPKSQVTNDTG